MTQQPSSSLKSYSATFANHLKRIAGTALVAMLATMSLTGCGDGGPKKTRIAVIPKGTSHEFWKSVHFGAQKAAKELNAAHQAAVESGDTAKAEALVGNIEIVYRGPVVESNTASQISVVKDMITMGVDGIILAPNQKGGLVDVVEEAIDEEIPVVIFDSGLDEGPEIVSYVATDNFKGGEIAGHALAKAIGEKGNVILLRYIAGSESTEKREEGFLSAIGAYPEIKVVSSDQYAGDTATKSKETADQLLQVHGESLAGIFAVCEPNANGTLESLKNAGLDGKVKFIAFDPSEALIEAMKSDQCDGIVLQDPVQMGYQSVMTLAKTLQGEKVDAVQSTGEYLANPDNMNDQDMKQLLKPELAE